MAANVGCHSTSAGFDGRLRAGLSAFCVLAIVASGCQEERPVEGRGEGPGHRAQVLALNPQQEIQLGRQAYREILSQPEKFGEVLPDDAPETERVREVARRIIAAWGIEPLRQEINLHPGRFDWEIHVLESPQVNAFCLPGGKIAVFTGLLRVVQNDDQLATVISHETAHALAHHVSERIAYESSGQGALALLRGKAFDRAQEAEADHIGLFLMTFAGYNPDEAVRFWQRMEELSARQPRLPEILSDHPSDDRRLRNMAQWAPRAKAAKQAYDEGHIGPPTQSSLRFSRNRLWVKSWTHPHALSFESIVAVRNIDAPITAYLPRRLQ